LNVECIPRDKGLYILLGYVTKDVSINVGRLGTILFRRGFYLYIGSAKGAGGLYTRLKRHLLRSKKTRWHIDYLTVNPHFKPLFIFYTTNLDLSEDIIVSTLVNHGFKIAVKGFGSTDDVKVESHLLYTQEEPLKTIVVKVLQAVKKLGKEFNVINLNKTLIV